MKLRHFAAVGGAMLILSASGCNVIQFNLEDALRPPKTMGDEAEIEQLIADSAAGGYTLKYPKNGTYRSAIIMRDLDGDDVSEAVAFFRGKDETTRLHMLVMYENEGEWTVSADFVTETTDVDSVDFADVTGSGTTDILVGYTTYTPGVSFLSCYEYKNGATTAVSAGQSYSAFYCGSLDQNGGTEVITLSLYNADTEAKASMLEFDREKRSLFVKSSVAMDPGVVKFRHVTIGELGGSVRGIAVDGAYASEEICTQVIYYNRELAVLRNPLYRDKLKNVTLRTIDAFSEDVNADRVIDIPTVEKLPFADADSLKFTADKVTYSVFDAANERLELQEICAVNIGGGYRVKIPEAWENGSYTAQIRDNSMVFSAWEDGRLGDELFEIRAFEAAEWDQGKDNDNFTLITRDNRRAYALSNHTKDSQYELTDNEIKTSFSLLSSIG